MNTWTEKYDFVGNIRGLGLSIGVDIISDKQNKTKDPDAALKITNRCFDKGVLMIAFAGSVLRFQPPLNISIEELDKALDIIEEAMNDFRDGKLNEYNTTGQGW